MTALPPIDQSLLPADVRKGTSADKLYATALGFERTLVNELTKAMADTAQPVDGGDDSSSSSDSGDDTSQPQDAATSMYTQMLPDQLADSITQNGGLGLARSFYDSLKDRAQ